MGVIRMLCALLSGKPARTRLPDQIERCKAAMVRRNARMMELWRSVDYPGQDEHHAALGGCNGEYDALIEKNLRAGKWLCVLLRKRGQPEDLRLARAIDMQVWP